MDSAVKECKRKGISFVAFCENSGLLRARSWWFHLPLGEKSELLVGANYNSFVTASAPSGVSIQRWFLVKKKGEENRLFCQYAYDS